MTALQTAYAQFTVGSNGFCQYIETHGNLEISREEIERIAAVSPTAEAFQNTWENSDAWTDANNE